MTHKLTILNSTGDTVLTWDPKVEEETKVAEVEFDRLSRTMMGFTDTTPAEQIKKFDPQKDIIMTPQLQGG